MKPIGPLMVEHRLIERMLSLLEKELRAMKEYASWNPVFLDSAVDFLRIYADRTHHGKEEEIYFRNLADKPLTPELKEIMEELVEEHAYAREKVGGLVAAKARFMGGDPAALDDVLTHLDDLIAFYPSHIEKEDRRFFFPSQEYFSREEQEAMLLKFHDFDARMIHEKYSRLVESRESQFEGMQA
jgi:hemerythrin-like domain-containing protein